MQHSSSFRVTVKFPHPVIYEPDVHVMPANMSAQAGEIKQERTHWPLSSQLPNVSVTSIYCSLRLHIIPSTWDQIWLRNSLKYLPGQPVFCEVKGDNEMKTWMRHHPHILNNSGNVIFAKTYMMYSSSSQPHLLLTGILYMYCMLPRQLFTWVYMFKDAFLFNVKISVGLTFPLRLSAFNVLSMTKRWSNQSAIL